MANPHINDFIQSLNAEETKIVNEYFDRLYSGENKIKKLFEILTADRNRKYTDKELSVLLKNDEGAIRVLKSRLFNCVKEALVQDSHFENESVFSERERLVFILKKRILLLKSLYRNQNQGRIGTINLLLKDCIQLAKKNQIYDILSEALILKKHMTGIRHGFESYDAITKEIEFYTFCFKTIHDANDIYFHITLNDAFVSSLTKKEKYEFLFRSIQKMEADYKKTRSEEISYFLQQVRMALYEHEKKFYHAFNCCKKLLSKVEKSPILHNKARVGFMISNLSYFRILQGNYKDSLTYAKKALSFHHSNSLHFLIIKEQEFYGHFYSNDFKNAIKSLEEMLQHSLVDTGEYRKSKFTFYKACILFKVKDFKSSIQILTKSLKIEQDKAGWNIFLRILIIMIHIELAKFREASVSISALRKHMERNGKTKEISPRDNLIFKLLRELEKDHFKRNEKNKTAMKLLNDLSDKNKPTAWNHFTPEMIPFHEWVMTLPVKNT